MKPPKMINKRLNGILLMCGCLVSLPCLAQTGATDLAMLSEESFLGEMPVVLSASRLRQPLSETPSAMTVIDRDMIRASGFREIADLFRMVPGFTVSNSTYVRGFTPIVGYHGMAGELSGRLQVLVDGRAVYNPTLGSVSWGNLPLAIEDIERIEVIRGPSTAAHGANAFLGVINITTRQPAADVGTTVVLRRGERDVSDALLRHGGAWREVDYRFTLGVKNDNPYGSYIDNRTFANNADYRDSRVINLVTFHADYQLNPRDALEFQFGYNGGKRGTQAANQPDETDYPRDIAIRNHFQQIRWQRIFSPGDEISVQLYHNTLREIDRFMTLPIAALGNRQFPMDDSVYAGRTDLEFQHTFAPTPDWRWVWGASSRRDVVEAPLTLSPGRVVGSTQHRLFGHGEWRISPKWLLNGGVMIEEHSLTDTDNSPQLAVNYHITPRHTVRASFSKALRMPTLLEEKANRFYHFDTFFLQAFLSSGGLKAERMFSRELGYLGEFPELGATLNVKLFRDQLGDLIGLCRTPGNPGRDFCNTDSAIQTGLETEVDYRPTTKSRLIASHSRLIINSTNIRQIYSVSAPVNMIKLLASHDFSGGFSASAGYYQQGDMKALGFSNRQEFSRRVDVRLAQTFKMRRGKGEIALVMQNLLSDEYTEFRAENVFDRRGYVTLTLDF